MFNKVAEVRLRLNPMKKLGSVTPSSAKTIQQWPSGLLKLFRASYRLIWALPDGLRRSLSFNTTCLPLLTPDFAVLHDLGWTQRQEIHFQPHSHASNHQVSVGACCSCGAFLASNSLQNAISREKENEKKRSPLLNYSAIVKVATS